MALFAEEWSPFTFPDIWKVSFLATDDVISPEGLVQPVDLDLPATKIDNPYAASKPLELALHLPNLDTFEFGQIEPPDLSDESVTSQEDEHAHVPPRDDSSDPWCMPEVFRSVESDNRLHSWETFAKQPHRQPRSEYLSEAGPGAFDAALKLQYEQKSTSESQGLGKTIRSDAVLNGLWLLGLGRPSVLFPFDETKRGFVTAIQNSCITGHSFASSQSLIQRFIDGANSFVQLRDFVERAYASDSTCSAVLALASSVSVTIAALENSFCTLKSTVQTPIQLQHQCQRLHEILGIMQELVAAVSKAKSDYEALDLTFAKVQQLYKADSWSNDILQQTLIRISAPWLHTVEVVIGLRPSQGLQIEQLCNREALLENLYGGQSQKRKGDGVDEPKISNPSNILGQLIVQKERDLIQETSQGLRFLEQNHPDHLRILPTFTGGTAPNLNLAFDWVAVEKISIQAKAYENSLREAIQRFKSPGNSHEDRYRPNQLESADKRRELQLHNVDYAQQLEDSLLVLNRLPSSTTETADELFNQVKYCARPTAEGPVSIDVGLDFKPPISILPSLSFSPLLEAQSHIINRISLEALFNKCRLREHLSLNYAFQLFGSGTFVSRLASVLFDPDFSTTERQRGVMRTGSSLGLRLGSGTRQNWPPASSELRLALMGILNESWHSDSRQSFRGSGTQLPGHISFGIRELPNDQIDQCLEVNSVYALDFLRLQYKPPPALRDFFSDAALEKYDRAFRFFLKLLRMTFVVNMLSHQDACSRKMRASREEQTKQALSRRFRIEAQHFVSTLCTHFFTNAVGAPWQRFLEQLSAIEDGLLSSELNISSMFSIAKLQRQHSETLDSVLAGLLLRQRQQNIAKLVEEIFGHVLEFAHHQRVGTSEPSSHGLENGLQPTVMAKSLATIYESFKVKVRAFIDACDSAAEPAKRHVRSQHSAKDDASRSALQLMQLLNLSGYYT